MIGTQYDSYMSLPGPIYAGDGYTELSRAIRTGPDSVSAYIKSGKVDVNEVTTGSASPLHVACMGKVGQASVSVLLESGAVIEKRDSWGYTPLQRAATNDLDIAAKALLDAGADRHAKSGLELKGESARELAVRLRSFKVLKVIQQYEIANDILPTGEYIL